MISLEDCIGMCGLDENEVAAIAEHEHIPEIAAAALASYLLNQPHGGEATRPPRDYLGGSRLGHPCERALQFEFAGAPKDDGAEFSGRTLRIFGIGHALEDLAVRWLRGAGFDLYTRKGKQPALASPGKPRPPL